MTDKHRSTDASHRVLVRPWHHGHGVGDMLITIPVAYLAELVKKATKEGVRLGVPAGVRLGGAAMAQTRRTEKLVERNADGQIVRITEQPAPEDVAKPR